MKFATTLFLALSVGVCGAADKDGARPRAAPVPRAKAAAESPARDAAEADPLEGKLWERFTDDEQAEHVARLKAVAEQTKQKIDTPRLKLYETPYLLFITDLDPNEARRWQQLLGRMYDMMLETFAIPKGTNVWRGKALVYVFKSREDFIRYESVIENNDVGRTTAGICHSGGDVRIAFYRQPDVQAFATVLVHESSHGFLHRYRSPVHITPWINEGLAEWIAYELVPMSDWKNGRVKSARDNLTKFGSTQDMFNQWNGAWHYGAAYTLTEYMIVRNKKGYVAFINAIKDGKEWPAALEEDYGTSLDRLVHFYGLEFIGKPLRP